MITIGGAHLVCERVERKSPLLGKPGKALLLLKLMGRMCPNLAKHVRQSSPQAKDPSPPRGGPVRSPRECLYPRSGTLLLSVPPMPLCPKCAITTPDVKVLAQGV